MATKIVMIEDDQAIAQMYKMKLEAEGFKVFTALNGKVGLEMCKKLNPEIILLDLMMPIMRGDEMLAKLRKTDWGKDIKVIVITNVGEAQIAEKVRSLGVLDILTKAQLTPTELVNKIRDLT